MRPLKKVLAIAAICASALLICWYGTLAYSARAVEDTFFMRNAALEDPELLRKLESAPERDDSQRTRFGFFVHRITKGEGMVLGYRYYSGGDPLIIDDEGFNKITIWLPSEAPQGTSTFDLADARRAQVFSSAGGSAWPSLECSGVISSGKMTIQFDGASAVVSIEGALQPLGSSRQFDTCKPQPANLTFKATELSVDRLTPWLGARPAEEDSIAETFR